MITHLQLRFDILSMWIFYILCRFNITYKLSWKAKVKRTCTCYRYGRVISREYFRNLNGRFLWYKTDETKINHVQMFSTIFGFFQWGENGNTWAQSPGFYVEYLGGILGIRVFLLFLPLWWLQPKTSSSNV